MAGQVHVHLVFNQVYIHLMYKQVYIHPMFNQAYIHHTSCLSRCVYTLYRLYTPYQFRCMCTLWKGTVFFFVFFFIILGAHDVAVHTVLHLFHSMRVFF